MNRNDDFDHTLNAWLRGEAPPEAPDRVLDTALRRVADQPQRRGWLDRLQKGTQMSLILRATAVAAVIAIAAFMGLHFANLTPGVGGPSSPSSTEAATAIPSTTPIPSTTLPSPTPVPIQTPAADCVNPPPDIAALRDQTDPVACYGNAPLTLDAYPVAVSVDCPVSVEPAWLGCPSGELMLVGETRKVGAPFLLVVVDPASGVSLSEHFYTNVRITGHYDDPAAQTCRETGRSPAIGGTPEPAAETIARCRGFFVVTQVVPVHP